VSVSAEMQKLMAFLSKFHARHDPVSHDPQVNADRGRHLDIQADRIYRESDGRYGWFVEPAEFAEAQIKEVGE